MKLFHQKLFRLALVLTMLLLTGAPSTAQPNSNATTENAVIFDNNQLFQIKTGTGDQSAKSRAKSASEKITELSRKSNFNIDEISTTETDKEIDIVASGIRIIAITAADAQADGQSKQSLADNYVEILKSALSNHKVKSNLNAALEDASLQNVMNGVQQVIFEPLTLKIILAIGTLTLISIIAAFLGRNADRYVEEADKRYASKKIIVFVGYFIALLSVTIIFKDAFGNIAVVLGAATAGVAFALKEVIASIAGWIAVTFGNFYKVGDRIQLGGIKGDVIDIGFGRTTLMELGEWVKGDLYTGRIVRVSNSFVFSEPFFNYSGDFPFLWDEFTIPIKYGCDYKFARKMLDQIAQEITVEYSKAAATSWSRVEHKYLVESASTEPMVTLVINDNWMEFTVRYVVDYRKRRTTKDQFFTRIMEEIDKSQGRVLMASATFQLVEAPVIAVHLSGQVPGV